MADLSFLDPNMNPTDETPMGAVSPDLSFLDPDQNVRPSDPTPLINARELTHGMDPQRTAKVIDLSRKAGLPPRIVEERMDEIERREMLNDGLLADVASKAPKTTSFLSDPDRFAVAQADIENLAELEGLMSYDFFGNPMDPNMAKNNPLAKELIADPAMAVTKGLLRAPGQLLEGAANIFSIPVGAVASAVEGYEQLTGVPAGGYFSELQDATLSAAKWIRENMVDIEPLLISEDLRGKGVWDNPEVLLDPEWAAYTTTDILPSIIASFAAYLAGGPLAAGLVGGGMEGGSLQAELLEEGMEPWKANVAGQVFGLFTGALNAIGADKVLGQGVSKNLMHRLFKGFFLKGGIEGTTEWAEEFIQPLVAGIARGDSRSEIAAAVVEGAKRGLDVFVPSLITGGLMGTATERMEYQKAQFAAKEQEVLDMLTENVAQSNLAQLDPVLYQEALTVLKEGGKISDIHIPASAIMSYNLAEVSEILNQLGVSFEAFDLALNSGGAVAIPVEKYGAAIAANPDLAVRFANDRKLSADGYTRNELAQFNQEWAQEAKRVLQLAAETEELKDQEDAETKAIYEQVYTARQAAGRVPDAARLDAAQFTAALVSMAKMSEGKYTPAQLFEAYMPQVTAGQAAAVIEGVEEPLFQLRTKPAPQKTVKAYKLFRVDPRQPGKLFPLFVDANTPVEMGQWLDAEVGEMAKDGKKVKSKIGPLAFRPGWHAGDLPIATHIGLKAAPNDSAPSFRNPDHVWAEIEMAADVDWQEEANRRARVTKAGTIDAKTAHITDQLPEDGFYRYKTNSNMTGSWLIGGSMKVNRILTDDEVRQINEAAGVADLPRTAPFDAARYGFGGPITYQPELTDRIVNALNSQEGPATSDEVAAPPTLYQVQNLPEWKDKTRAWMQKNGYSQDEISRHMAAIEGQMKIFGALGPVQLEMLPQGAGIAPAKGKISGPIRSNADAIYKITFDASAMCVKRLEAAATAAEVERRLGRPLIASERMALVALFKSAGKQAPCLYCYVEAPRSKRATLMQQAQDVIQGNTKPKSSWSAKTKNALAAAQEEYNALGLTEIDPRVVTDPEFAETPEGKELRKRMPKIFAAMELVGAGATANLPKLYEEYNGQILALPQKLLDELNNYAGLRFFSSSDFQAEHVADLMQAFFDMEIRRAKSHAYTKVPDYVRIFGPTGQKIQTSIFAKEENGEIVMDDWQGMDWETAKAFREQYPNVGTVLVAGSDAIVAWGLEQDWVDYIIPFHYSGLEKKFYETLGWQDFTATQNEKSIGKGKAKKIRMHETGAVGGITTEQGTRNYLALAMERKLVPVFPAFLFKDGAEPVLDKKGKPVKNQRLAQTKRAVERWKAMVAAGEIDWDVINPNYYKVKKDYARTDTPFDPVKAEFNLDHADTVLQAFLRGEAPSAKVDAEIADKLQSMIGAAPAGFDIGVEALRKVNEGQTLFQQADIPRTLESLRAKLKEMGFDEFISERPDSISISKIALPKESRGQGLGSKAMQMILQYADSRGKRVVLSPSKDFGASSVDRLKKFYKRFGFVENKGRNKDYSISDTMYREPQGQPLFQRVMPVDKPGPGGIVKEKEVVYARASQRDEDPVSPRGGEGALSEERGMRPLPGARIVELRTAEKRSVPAAVSSPRQAAAAMSFLSDSPQEQVAALVLDAKGRPLSILSHSIGTMDSSQIDYKALLGAIQDVEGASSFYLAHNHPAENAELSAADRALSENIRSINEGSGVSYGGLFAVTPDRYADEYAGGLSYTAPGKQKKIAVVQRMFSKVERVEGIGPISSPDDIKRNLDAITGGVNSGVIFLTNNNAPVGFLPMTPSEMAVLRGDRLGEVLKSIHRTNATGLVGILPNESALPDWRNVAAMANAISARPLDALYVGESGKFESARMQGKDVDAWKRTTFYQQQSPLGFVSAVETAIDGMDFKTMPGKDLANRVKKTGGIKAEELEDLGLIEWLEGAGKVTKDQVMAFVRNGGPQIEEVVKGKQRRVTAEERAVYEELTTRGWDTLSEEERAVHDDLWERLGSRNRDTSKFSQYTMPGGENYREVLMTLPDASNRESARKDAIAAELESMEMTPETQARREELRAEYRDLSDAILARGSYQSSHWDEPNVLAHFRLNDRTGPDGKKVLFIEEIQSDWHQEGRKKGYREEREKRFRDMIARRNALPEDSPERARLNEDIDKMSVEDVGVPDAPFKKSWNMLAMKRILRMAAEQGYASVAWTPGEVQAERYDLSKQVDKISHIKNADGTYDLIVHAKNGGPQDFRGQTPSEIESLVGKEVADKIISEEGAQSPASRMKVLSGLDLKVGGEGMKGFYDKILPAEVNKYVKKWGVKAAPGTVSGQQVWALPITDQMRQDILQGQPLYQQQGEPQASFTFKTKSGKPLIELFRTANQSSFLHETGHLYLEMVRELALQENSPAPVTALWAQTKAALKIDDGPISREAHEEWARNLEAYFLEGAAPSLGLRKIFAQYAQWLRSIYKQVEQIFLQSGTQFNEDLKPIFDRIFATEKDIEEARSFYSSQKPFFAALDPKVMAKEREKYEERRMRARESMEDKRLRQLTEAWVKVSGGKGKIRAEVAEEVKARPVMAIIKGAAGGMNMAALDASVGEDLRKQLKAIGRYSSLVKKEGTVDPDILAAENGYDSAVAMVEDLISFPGEKAAITAGVEARMEAERQRISRGLAETDLAADEAYHNDDQLAVLVAEFEILSQQAAQKTKRLEAAMVRDVARQLLASEKVNFATQTGRFARLERRAAKLARDAYERGDAKKAADYKRQEVLNHAMFIESVALKEAVAKTAARIKRGIQKTKGISPEVKTLLQGLGIQYGILPYKKERDPVRAFEMWNQDLVAKGGKIPTIEGWVDEMRKLGISAPLDPFLNNAAAVPYQQITVGQFRALEEGVRILRRVDRGLHTVTWIDGSTITMEDAIERLHAHVAGRGGKAPDPLTYDPNAVTLAARNFFAEHTKASTIIQALDNWEAGGLFYQLIYRPVMDADSDLSARWAAEAPKIKALFEPIRRQLRKKVVVLGKARPRAQLVAAALNVGNQGNRERLIAGLGINEAQLDQLLAPLTTEEMDFVQAVWDYIATFKDEAFAVERRLTGREPAAVDPVPFVFKGKTYAGGYYPVSYDKNLRDQKGEARDAKEALDELFGGTPAGTAMTAHGHLEARASAGTGERLSQELSVISDHVAQVLRDITHREAVVNVAKLLKNKQIMAMITDVVGREKAKQLWPWLVSVSKEGREQIQLTAVEKMLLHFRPAMTFYTQAYKVGTALMQAAGFFQVFEFVKPWHVGQAVWQLYGKGLLSLNMFSDGEIISHPLIKEIREKSPQMNERLLNADRDIRDATKEFSTSESALATYKKAGFKATVAMQFYVADVVAWQGAYLQALTDGMTEKDAINRADFVVEQAMGAGYTRALSKIQRGGSIQRFLTMFYTFGSVLYNLAARRAGITKKQLASGQYGAAALGASSFLVLQWVMPVLLEALVRGDVADDDDDEALIEKLLVNLMTYPAQAVLIARELSGIAKGFKYRFSPAVKPFESVGQWISSVARAIEQEDASIAAKPTAQLVGTTTGLIPAQFINSGEVLTDYLTGEDPELSVKELMYGKRRQ